MIVDPVQSQYERWVYPKPLDDLSAPDVVSQRLDSDPFVLGPSYWPKRQSLDDLKILIAGCGANLAAKIAFDNPRTSVIGLDISAASLAHEEYLKKKHNLRNLILCKGLVENAETLQRQFDLIDCSGVLHHLDDPVSGLRTLAKLLEPSGVIYLMLYAPYGRSGIYMAQDLFRRLGLAQTPEDVAFVKRTLTLFPENHPIGETLTRMTDWRYDAGIVDLLLHARDRAFTVGQCLQLVESAGLRFGGWRENYFYYPDGQLPPTSELYRRVARLSDHELWQVMELVHGRIAKHSFCACKPGNPVADSHVRFPEGDLLEKTPFLQGGIGARNEGGVVILSHPRIPSLALDRTAASVIRQIDGRRTVRSCLAAADAEMGSERAPALDYSTVFRRLWRFGYVRLADI